MSRCARSLILTSLNQGANHGFVSQHKVSVCNHVILNVPHTRDSFTLHTDASGRGIGRVLNITRQGQLLPVAFYSRQLRGSEICYSAIELEALTMLEMVKYFWHYLYGVSFSVVTDHQALCFLLSSSYLNR